MKGIVIGTIGMIVFGAFLFWLFQPSDNVSLASQIASSQHSESQGADNGEGKVRALDYDLKTFDGQDVSFSAVNSEKPVVIQVWATWCEICEIEFPENNVIAQKYQDQVAFHAVSIGGSDQSADAIKKYVNRKNLDPEAIKFLVDTKATVSSQYGFYSTPQHIFVAKGGEIQFYQPGYMRPDEMEQRLQSLIES